MSEVPLDVLAKEIIAQYKRGNDMLISAGQRMLEAKRRIEGGEAGPEWTWIRWRAVNLIPHMSKQWINTQLKIAGSHDPEEAAKEFRKKHAESRRKSIRQNGNGKHVLSASAGIYPAAKSTESDHEFEENALWFLDLSRADQDRFLLRIGAVRAVDAAT